MLSLEEEEDFGFGLYSHELFSPDVEEVKEDFLKDIPNFLPSNIQLKSLTSHLKEASLGPSKTLPIITPSLVSLEQEHALLDILSSHKSAIAWVLMTLKGLALKLVSIGFFLTRIPSHLDNLKDDLTLICLK